MLDNSTSEKYYGKITDKIPETYIELIIFPRRRSEAF